MSYPVARKVHAQVLLLLDTFHVEPLQTLTVLSQTLSETVTRLLCFSCLNITDNTCRRAASFHLAQILRAFTQEQPA